MASAVPVGREVVTPGQGSLLQAVPRSSTHAGKRSRQAGRAERFEERHPSGVPRAPFPSCRIIFRMPHSHLLSAGSATRRLLHATTVCGRPKETCGSGTESSKSCPRIEAGCACCAKRGGGHLVSTAHGIEWRLDWVAVRHASSIWMSATRRACLRTGPIKTHPFWTKAPRRQDVRCRETTHSR
jgi:hypothetical protein